MKQTRIWKISEATSLKYRPLYDFGYVCENFQKLPSDHISEVYCILKRHSRHVIMDFLWNEPFILMHFFQSPNFRWCFCMPLKWCLYWILVIMNFSRLSLDVKTRLVCMNKCELTGWKMDTDNSIYNVIAFSHDHRDFTSGQCKPHFRN